MTGTRLMIITLFVVAVICAVVLSFVYAFTEPRIAETQAKLTLSGLEEVISAYKYLEVVPGTLWKAMDSLDQEIGIVFRVFPQGYGGQIPITVGLNEAGKITGIRIASAAEGLSETPGLGMKVTEPGFTSQFKNKGADEVALKQDGGAIQAITAATISSRAVSEGIKKGIRTYARYLETAYDMKSVFPEGDNFIEIIPDTLWYALSKADTVGIVFISSIKGYLDRIGFMVGCNKKGEITGVAILYSQETEGIGEVIRSEEFLGRFKQGKPEAVSGATISTRALINGVAEGLQKYKEYLK
jgi:electron transport complex protein RnfG